MNRNSFSAIFLIKWTMVRANKDWRRKRALNIHSTYATSGWKTWNNFENKKKKVAKSTYTHSMEDAKILICCYFVILCVWTVTWISISFHSFHFICIELIFLHHAHYLPFYLSILLPSPPPFLCIYICIFFILLLSHLPWRKW